MKTEHRQHTPLMIDDVRRGSADEDAGHDGVGQQGSSNPGEVPAGVSESPTLCSMQGCDALGDKKRGQARHEHRADSSLEEVHAHMMMMARTPRGLRRPL